MRKSKATLMVKEHGSINIETWLQHFKSKLTNQNLNRIRQTTVFSQLTGENHATPNGLSCFQQGLVMAEILADLNVDTETLIAAMIYSGLRYGDLTIADIKEHFKPDVAKLLQGTIRMDASQYLNAGKTLTSDVDKFRKMLLAMVDDMRVVLIKLAERVSVLRNMPLYTDEQKQHQAQLAIDIYAPLANRLGIGHLKWELEDLAFRNLEVKRYKEISKSLNSRREQREQHVKKVIELLENMLKEHNIHEFEVSGRAKHIYSIYKKMQRKNVDISEIYDSIAFRVLVPSIEDCYTVLGFVHSNWEHIPQEFDDYVAQPKPNGYQSIHTAIHGPDKVVVEIQVRTFTMHEEAELGVAAHWVYKEGGKAVQSSYEAKIALLRQVMDWQQEVTENEPESKELQQHVFDDRVYVFTPNGDIMDLPTGATPLDFAYHVHSEVGNRTRGAKINGKLVQLSYQLKTGDQVEIVIAKQGTPSRDWLNPHLGYLITGRARAKVHNYFRQLDYDDNVDEGKTIIEREEKRLNLKNINYQHVAEKLHLKNPEEMHAALGRGDIRINTVVNAIASLQEKEKPVEEQAEVFEPRAKPTTKHHPTEIDILGVGNLLTQIANCCKPIPGDDIVGYVTLGRGISIHRADCPNILHNKRLNSNKLIDVSWGEQTLDRYSVDLIIDAFDRQGLVRDITNLLVQEKVSITSLNTLSNPKDNTAQLKLTIEILGLNPLSKITTRLLQINNVTNVRRIEH